MLERMKEARRNESGFTLIELLIVIVILGVLAGIVVFGVSAFNSSGVAAACKSDGKNVDVASEAFYAQTNGWAADIPALVSGGYLKNTPPLVAAGNKYYITYTQGSGATASTVKGLLADGTTVCYQAS